MQGTGTGRGVSLRGDGRVSRLASDATRAVFDWYRRNHSKWAGPNRKEDVEALASEVDNQPPVLAPLKAPDASRRFQLVHLKGIRGRIASLASTTTGRWIRPRRILNSRSKTRFLPVCGSSKAATHLAKHRFSPRFPGVSPDTSTAPRPAGKEDDPVEVHRADLVQGPEGEAGCQDIAAITPVPPNDVLKRLGAANVPLDTWVELTFVDSDGHDLGTIRRSVTRSRRGGIEVKDRISPSLAYPRLRWRLGRG